MQARSIRRAVLAAVAGAAGLALVTASGGTAGAAVVSQSLSCSPGGTQAVTLSASAPATVTQNDTYTVTLAPAGDPGTAAGAEIKNMVTTFQAPTGSSIVPGSASTSGGSGTLGAVSTTISGSTLALKVPGPIANGASFVNPTLTFQLKATGAPGTVLNLKLRSTAAYTLTAAGSINISCNASPATTLTSTTIQAGATSTTSATTPSTTGPATTAPPVITTQSWSPGTACGTPQAVTAPTNTTSVAITATGGKGGKAGSQASSTRHSGGTGGQATATFAASGGQVFSAVVGCNGADGPDSGANSTNAGGWSVGGSTGAGSVILLQTGAGGGGGGGSSAACLGASCQQGAGTPLVVAGGGGGAGVSNCAGTPAGVGGAGGSGANGNGEGGFGPAGATGGNGGNSGGSSDSIKGGAGGVNTDSPSGDGGNAPSTGTFDGGGVSVVAGGGGGGFAGGAQGQNASTGCKGAGGGGGGSSWVAGTATNATFSTFATAGVTLTFTITTPASTTTSSTTTTQPQTCTPDVVPFASVATAVDQQYQDFTGSAASSPQHLAWDGPIGDCSTGVDALSVSLLPTDLTTTDDARLVRLYLAYFKRPPDPDGFAYWKRQLDAGKGLINAANKFAQSKEFLRVYGPLTNGDFIDLVYLNVLEREPDPTGRAFWLTRLDNKTKNRGDVMINFSESSENVRRKADHVQVFRLFNAMRRRFPSKAEFFALMDPITTDGTTLIDTAHTIRTSAEYAARF